MKSLEERMKREHHREEAINRAVEAADRIILDASDGSCEETNYLTAQVARQFIKKALMPFCRDILKKDLE
jgi:20S proteasome alpha/beta subunit